MTNLYEIASHASTSFRKPFALVTFLFCLYHGLSAAEGPKKVSENSDILAPGLLPGPTLDSSLLLAQDEGRKKIKFKRSKKKRISVRETGRTDDGGTTVDAKAGKLRPQTGRASRILQPDEWFFKLSTNIGYMTLGPEFKKLIGQIEDVFGGGEIETDLMTYNTKFSITTKEPVKRASTHFLPTGNMGLGLISGNHRFEVDFGIAGLVPLNTVNVDTDMVMRESNVCDFATDPQAGSKCPMANLGFVDRATGEGQYEFKMVINESVWLLQPNFYYDYVFMRKPWGQLSAGGSLGLIFLSARQRIEFAGKRTDLDAETGEVTDAYRSRTLEGVADSTAINNMGPVLRAYVGLRKTFRLKKTDVTNDFKLGVTYGYVDLARSVDGNGSAVLGDTLVASFPTSALGFADEETNRFALTGVFIQLGLVF